jgi:hypothetical protein
MLTGDKSEACCPMMEKMREYFPIVPLVFPLLFPILPMICLLMYLGRITNSLGRIERQLNDILDTVRRIG